MKVIAKILSFLMPVKSYRKPFLHWLETLLFCSNKNNIYIWKIKKTAVKVGKNLVVGSKSKVNRKTIIGDHVQLYGLKVAGKGNVTIGSHSIIAGNCKIITQNHNYEGEMIPYDETFVYKDVVIEDFVWIGADVLILPGSVIGEGAIIQGGAVVHGKIPPYAIAGGNPVKVFGERDKAHFQKLKKEGKFYVI